MKSVIVIIDTAPHGIEKAYGALHVALVCLPHGATIGLYGDGGYLALPNMDTRNLGIPNHSHFLYTYPEVRVIAHKPSLEERGLLKLDLIELIEVKDGDEFFREVMDFDHVMLL